MNPIIASVAAVRLDVRLEWEVVEPVKGACTSTCVDRLSQLD